MLGAALQRPRGPAGICLVPQAAAGSYSTSFPLTENPISESGVWTPGTVFAPGSRTAVQTAGKAYGTMVSFDGTHFQDSCAFLSGFGPDQQVTVTLNVTSLTDVELEILLRCTGSASQLVAYEIDAVGNNKGINLVRWDGTAGSPQAFTILRNLVINEVGLATGDQIRAKIVGTFITVDYKPSGGSFSNLFTYETASDGTKYSGGNPGIGFWNQSGSAANEPNFAMSSFAAITL